MSHPPQCLPISLIIPAYEAENYLRKALESVAAQASVPAEIIVVDDASSDRTAEIAAECGARVICRQRNAGPSAARNAGVARASHPWIAFLDADDLWAGDKLAVQWAALQRWPDAGFCFTDYDVFDPAGRMRPREMAGDAGYALAVESARSGAAVRFEPGALARGLVRSMFIRQSSVVISRQLFCRAGGYDERLRLAEDYDLFLRIVDAAPAVAIERPLVVYQRRVLSLSVDPIAEIASIDRLWTAILRRPRRYPRAVVELIEGRRPATLRSGCRIALRLGRFSEALPFARKALSSDPSVATSGLFGLAKGLDNAAGRVAYRATRSLWHSFKQLGYANAQSGSIVERAVQSPQV